MHVRVLLLLLHAGMHTRMLLLLVSCRHEARIEASHLKQLPKLLVRPRLAQPRLAIPGCGNSRRSDTRGPAERSSEHVQPSPVPGMSQHVTCCELRCCDLPCW